MKEKTTENDRQEEKEAIIEEKISSYEDHKGKIKVFHQINIATWHIIQEEKECLNQTHMRKQYLHLIAFSG